MSGNEEFALTIIFPGQDSDLFCIFARAIIVHFCIESGEKKASGCLHPVSFQLPEADLIDHSRRKDGLIFEHLRMSVGCQKAYDLFTCYTHADGMADGVAS